MLIVLLAKIQTVQKNIRGRHWGPRKTSWHPVLAVSAARMQLSAPLFNRRCCSNLPMEILCVGTMGNATHTHHSVTPLGPRRIQADLKLHELPTQHATTHTATSHLQQRPHQAALVTELVAAQQPAFDTILTQMSNIQAHADIRLNSSYWQTAATAGHAMQCRTRCSDTIGYDSPPEVLTRLHSRVICILLTATITNCDLTTYVDTQRLHSPPEALHRFSYASLTHWKRWPW